MYFIKLLLIHRNILIFLVYTLLAILLILMVLKVIRNPNTIQLNVLLDF